MAFQIPNAPGWRLDVQHFTNRCIMLEYAITVTPSIEIIPSLARGLYRLLKRRALQRFPIRLSVFHLLSPASGFVNYFRGHSRTSLPAPSNMDNILIHQPSDVMNVLAALAHDRENLEELYSHSESVYYEISRIRLVFMPVHYVLNEPIGDRQEYVCNKLLWLNKECKRNDCVPSLLLHTFRKHPKFPAEHKSIAGIRKFLCVGNSNSDSNINVNNSESASNSYSNSNSNRNSENSNSKDNCDNIVNNSDNIVNSENNNSINNEDNVATYTFSLNDLCFIEQMYCAAGFPFVINVFDSSLQLIRTADPDQLDIENSRQKYGTNVWMVLANGHAMGFKKHQTAVLAAGQTLSWYQAVIQFSGICPRNVSPALRIRWHNNYNLTLVDLKKMALILFIECQHLQPCHVHIEEYLAKEYNIDMSTFSRVVKRLGRSAGHHFKYWCLRKKYVVIQPRCGPAKAAVSSSSLSSSLSSSASSSSSSSLSSSADVLSGNVVPVCISLKEKSIISSEGVAVGDCSVVNGSSTVPLLSPTPGVGTTSTSPIINRPNIPKKQKFPKAKAKKTDLYIPIFDAAAAKEPFHPKDVIAFDLETFSTEGGVGKNPEFICYNITTVREAIPPPPAIKSGPGGVGHEGYIVDVFAHVPEQVANGPLASPATPHNTC